MQNNLQNKKINSGNSQAKNRLIFYISMIVLPVAVVVLFYLYVNIQSFTMAFQEFDYQTGFGPAGFSNFVQIFSDFKTEDVLIRSLTTSLELFFWTFIFSAMLSVFFSYYVYKKHPLSGVFKIILYLPHIVSGLVFALMYKYFMDDALPEIIKTLTGNSVKGFISNVETAKTCAIVFTIWVSFGTNVLMYTSAMSSISPSIIESAELEGIKPMQELWYIVIPCIWPTFVTFMLTSIIGIFTNQMSLHAIYGVHANLYAKTSTFGYYLYVETLHAQEEYARYPYLSAMGLLLTGIAVPLTLVARWLMNKLGPKVI